MKLKMIAVIVIFVLTGFQALPAAAAWSDDPTVNTPVCTAYQDQQYMWSIGDGASGVILCWRDDRSLPTGYGEIYAQRLDAGGNELWAPDGVLLYGEGYINYNLALVSDGAGGAIVTWAGGPTTTADIYAQRVSAAGVPLWSADGVAVCNPPGTHIESQLVSDGAGGAIIAWQDGRDYSTSGPDIYAQRVNGSGVVQWAANGVPVCTEAEGQYDPRLVGDGAGGAIMTWADSRSLSGFDLYAQRIDSSGVVQWAANGVAVSTAAGDNEHYRIASASSGGVIIGWRDGRAAPDLSIYAQKVTLDGSMLWAADGVPVSPSYSEMYSMEMVAEDTGGAVFTWADNRNGDLDIYAQRINTNGGQRWAAGGVQICGADDHQYSPHLARNETDGVIISWSDVRTTPDEADIYSQHVDWFGNAHWAADGIPVCTAAGSQVGSWVITDQSGGAFVTWSDNRSGTDFDIYAQWVDANGYLGGLETINAALGCLPCSGTAPFSTRFRATMYNLLDDQYRQVAGRINILLANGSQVNNWRSGFTTLSPGETYNTSWYTTIPATGSVIGQNGFTLELEDITQTPYNQPPYMPSGDTDSYTVTVTVTAP